MRADIRRLLREETAAESYWDDTLLQQLWNEEMDYWVMELGDAWEGWTTTEFQTTINIGQSHYVLPEGASRIKRVVLVFNEGSSSFKVPLTRNERWSEAVFNTNAANISALGETYTYRLLGEHLVLEPTPTVLRTDGLLIELESAFDRFDDDADELNAAWPDVAETLLIYGTVVRAMAVEGSQGNIPQGLAGHLQAQYVQFGRKFTEYIQVRSAGRVFGSNYYLGD